jgi:cytidine deaminase
MRPTSEVHHAEAVGRAPAAQSVTRCISFQTCLYFFPNIRPRTRKRGNQMSISYKDLALEAKKAKKRAHAPYSRFRVGAALLTKDGKVYTGCNIENSSYSLTICAERTAIFKAYSEGSTRFKAIAIASDDAKFTPPCGACRQVLLDLAGNIDFVMIDSKNRLKVVKLKSLLPMAFTPSYLIQVQRPRK